MSKILWYILGISLSVGFLYYPAPDEEKIAGNLRGGLDCWTLPAFACPYTDQYCAETECNSGWFGYSCPSGSIQQEAVPAYLYCTKADAGFYDCGVPDQSVWQPCAIRSSCAETCAAAVAGDAMGTYFCLGPIGPTWNVNIFPMPALSVDGCRPPITT